jgi:hypothetical protein
MSTATTVPSDIKHYPTFRFVDYKVYHESKKWWQEALGLKGILESNTELWEQLQTNITDLVMKITSASTKLPPEAKRDLSKAITSINKVVACLDMACDLQVITPEEFQDFTDGFKGLVIQLKCFIKALGVKKEVGQEKAE